MCEQTVRLSNEYCIPIQSISVTLIYIFLVSYNRTGWQHENTHFLVAKIPFSPCEFWVPKICYTGTDSSITTKWGANMCTVQLQMITTPVFLKYFRKFAPNKMSFLAAIIRMSMVSDLRSLWGEGWTRTTPPATEFMRKVHMSSQSLPEVILHRLHIASCSEHKHRSCAVTESLVFFLTWAGSKVENCAWASEQEKERR